MGLVKARQTEALHLRPLIGAWCWRRKASRRQHRRRSKNFAGLIGDLCTVSLGGKIPDQKRLKILLKHFFSLLLQRRDFDAVRKEKGRLRSYLLTSLKHFLISERRRAMTAKRGKGQGFIPLEELSARERGEMEPTDCLSADRIYERRWALTLMEQVLRRLKDEYTNAGSAVLDQIRNDPRFQELAAEKTL
jgi:hypothetical protein